MDEKGIILSIDTSTLKRLEVDGRFVGWLDIWAGMLMLYQRGKWSVVNIQEEREKAQEAQNKI